MDGFQRIAIVGLGAIGASFGLALKRAAYRARLVGVDDAKTLFKAKQIGAVDDTCTSWQEGIAGADFVFLNTPMPEAERLIPQIARELPEGAVLSDATPLKLKISNILRADEKRRFAYIGLHVLRPASEEGLECACPDFFQGVPMLLTPAQQKDMEAFGRVKVLMATIGANVFGMTPEAHDQLVAEIQQLPRLVTTAYLDLIFSKDAADRPFAETFDQVLRTQFKDLSEKGADWHEEVSTNRDSIIPALRSLAGRLESLAEKLINGNAEAEIETGRDRAAQLLSNQGFRAPIPGVWVSLPSADSSLSCVAEVLARANIIAKEVETSRRDERCFVEILLESEADAESAFKRLKGAGFLTGKMS